MQGVKVEDLKRGIVSILPLLELLAAKTANTIDDQVVLFLKAILIADPEKVQGLLEQVK